MATVLIADELAPLLDAEPVPGHVVEWLPAEASTPGGDYGAIVPLLSRPIGPEELDALPRLRVVANCAVGYDNIDVDAASARDVVVTNTPEVLTEATADLTWALILAVTRRLKEGQALLASGAWRGWDPTELLGFDLRGGTLGIVGAGRIGQAAGRRAPAFGMHLLYAARHRKPAFERETGARRAELNALLAASDVVSVHLPSARATRGLFDRERFRRMKEGSYFINTARGDLVDEAALLAALAEGPLRGAGLDVFADEPRVAPPLIRHPRVVALPHIGSATTATRRAMAALAVANVRAVLAGEPPVTPVSR